MKISIACVGRIKERYFAEAIAEYMKRLRLYAVMEIAEAADEKAPERMSDAEMEQVKVKEGERLLKLIPANAYVVALAIDGEKLSSEGLAARLDKLMTGGVSHVVFVIGGSLGLTAGVLARADMKLSFSDMTFPHQLMRVVLLEQVYRVFRILKNEPYHK